SRERDPFTVLKEPWDKYDLQINDHRDSHPRVNIAVYYAHSSVRSIHFFNELSEFWTNFGKGAFLSDQRVFDAFLDNYDKLESTYIKLWTDLGHDYPIPPMKKMNWTKHTFDNKFHHLFSDGNAYYLMERATKSGLRSNKFYNSSAFYITALYSNTATNKLPCKKCATLNDWSLLMRSLLAVQQIYPNRIMVLPTFNQTPKVHSILDTRKLFKYWGEDKIRLNNFLELNSSQSLFSSWKNVWIGYCEKSEQSAVDSIDVHCIKSPSGATENELKTILSKYENYHMVNFVYLEFSQFSEAKQT
ncbi:unnamed protein product, partial [Didymodactylos carnosus]